MKKILLTLLISTTLLAMSCEEKEPETNPFIGTWQTTHR